jgi:hypothetical protein
MECPVNLLHWRSEPDQDEISKCESLNISQPVVKMSGQLIFRRFFWPTE